MFVDTERCAGCWSCVMVCPIGRVAPHIGEPSDEDSRTVPTFAFKCDGCPREGIAPCVRSCPTAALVATDPASPEAQMNRRRAYATRLLANAGLSDPKIKITER
jgi:carbon-monoxide dehydrogenase iron sulfur subunit